MAISRTRFFAVLMVIFTALVGANLTPIKASAAAASLTQSWSSSSFTTGINAMEVGNGKLWIARDTSSITILDATTGAYVRSISLSYEPYRLSWDGTSMWVGFTNSASVAKISSSYVVTYSSSICSGPSANNSLWTGGGRVFVSCYFQSELFEISASNFSQLQSYSPGANIFGLSVNSSKVFLDLGNNLEILDAANIGAGGTLLTLSFPMAFRHYHAMDSSYYWQVGGDPGAPTKLLRVKISDDSYSVFNASVGNYELINRISSDGAYVYLPNTSAGTFSSFDITNSTLHTQFSSSNQRASAVSGSAVYAAYGDVVYGYNVATSQTVTWNPTNTANFLAASPVTPSSAATSSGPGAITYSVVGTGGTGCTVDANSGAVSATALGVCTVRATAAASGFYTSAFADVQFSFKTTQTITWAPSNTTNQVGYVGIDAVATSDRLGWITYSVQNAGTTGCVVNSTPSVSASSAGVCVIRATGAATSTAFSGFVDVAFTFNSTQTVSWNANNISNFLYSSPITPSVAATSSGPGAISYSVQSAGTTGCSVNASTGVVTATSVGDCVVRATAAATTYYSSAYLDKTFTFLSGQTVTWTPNTTIMATGLPVSVSSQATSTGPGAIGYTVISAGATGCTVNNSTGAITATSAGTCVVSAYSEATSYYFAGSTSVNFSIQKAQTVTWTPNVTQLQVGWSPYTGIFAATSDGTGGITYAVQDAGTTGCTFNTVSRTITYTGKGNCVVRATAGASGNWLSGYVDVTFTILESQMILWGGMNFTQSSGTYTPSTPTAYANNGMLTPTGASFVYSVLSAGTTGCTVDSVSGVITWLAIGLCQITATAQAIGFYVGGAISTANFNFYANQTVTWAPTNTTNSFSAGAVTPNAAATSTGPGTISYSLALANAACSLNTVTGVISANARTTCYVRANAAATGYYNSAVGSLVLFRFAGPQTMSWAATNTTNPSTHSVTPNAVPVKQGGLISYSVVAGGTGNCTVDAVTGVISPSTIGTCIIRATSAAFLTYEEGSIDKTFTFVPGQIVTWAATNTSNLTSAGAVTPSALASTNTGAAITYSVQSAGTTGCTVNSVTAVVTPLSDGICVVRATAAATLNEVSDYTDLSFSFNAPMNINSVSSSTSPDVYLTAWNQKYVVVGSTPVVSVSGFGFTSNVQIALGGKPIDVQSISATTLTFVLPKLEVGEYTYVITFGNSAVITVQQGIRVVSPTPIATIPLVTSTANNNSASMSRVESLLAKVVSAIGVPVKLVCTAYVATGTSAQKRSQTAATTKSMCSRSATRVGTKLFAVKVLQVSKASSLLRKATLALEVQGN